MNILMLTNTYTPFVGGVSRSVESFTLRFREMGHRVMIIAPESTPLPSREFDVIRVPAFQHFNGSDFSVQLPIPGIVSEALEGFEPDIVHSHHPYLLGDTALRLAAKYEVPIIFTNHTLYERYTHYVPGDSPLLRRFVIALSVGYANLCNRVFSPSESVARLLRERGVKATVHVVPTGIDLKLFSTGSGKSVRQSRGIPNDAFVVGFVSRIAPEKNILFLCQAVSEFLNRVGNAHFLLVGAGPSQDEVRDFFRKRGLKSRFHPLGILQKQDLADAYHAMDVFAFASKSETQGIVIAEAMAAGVPVVALDAPGVREVVTDGENGFLLPKEDRNDLVGALCRIRRMNKKEYLMFTKRAYRTAGQFTIECCVGRALDIYREAIRAGCKPQYGDDNPWEEAKRVIRAEWDLLVNLVHAAGSAVSYTMFDEHHTEGRDR